MPRPFIFIFIVYSLAGACMVPIFMEREVPLLLPFHWHKSLHILGAVLLLGNMFVTAGWTVAARYSKSWPLLRWSVKIATWMDVFFTAPGFFLLTANGMFLASAWGGIYSWSWLTAAMIMLGLTGVVGMVALPLQVKLWRLADELADSDEPTPRFMRLLSLWGLFGTPAGLGPVGILFLMVLKPKLW